MSYKVDFNFIATLEGGQKLQGYVPAVATSQSGVTIATGFDLGAHTKSDLQGLLLSPGVIAKLEPYLGKKTFTAKAFLAEKPLVITKAEADSIDAASHSSAIKSVAAAYNRAITASPQLPRFEQLPTEAQTVIVSVAFQYGTNLASRTPSFWKLITTQSWQKTVTELRNFGDKYATRRNKEADLLARMLNGANKKPQAVTGVANPKDPPGGSSAGSLAGDAFTAISSSFADIFGASKQTSIHGSVGKGGKNQRDDVKLVQKLLNRHVLPPRRLLDENGLVTDALVAAIFDFQQRVVGFKHPDGLVEPTGRTYQCLTEKPASHSSGAAPSPPKGASTPATPGTQKPPPATGLPATGATGPFFPFTEVTRYSWAAGARAFGSNRSGGTRAHAGCDLYYPKGTWIHAVADGIVVRGPYDFYSQTYAIEVDHGSFLLRYGEIMAGAPVKTGEVVKAGQRIAQVGHLVGISVESDMLHIEMYSKAAAGSLSVKGSAGAKRKDGVLFHRRSDLIDPTPHLNIWRNNLPKG